MTTISTNFEEIRDNIRTIFAKGNEEIRKDATPYGFEGLELTPIIDFGTDDGVNFVTAKIKKELLELWNMTESEVIEIGLNNLTYNITSLGELIGRMMGMEDDYPETPDMYVVSNGSNYKGASSVIPATKELMERFPDGYMVLPSSIHEVIVVPKGTMDGETLNEMVIQVNAEVVAEEDRLSDDVYEFVA